MIHLEISVDYLQREGIYPTLEQYCKRNKIENNIVPKQLRNGIAMYRQFVFKSAHQRKIFLTKMHRKFPYFEFE